MKVLFRVICKLINRFFPEWTYLFARPIPGLTPTAEQLKNRRG